MDWVRDQVAFLCKEIRAVAVPLVDSFNFSDFIINSPLGRYDGNIYESYFNLVQSANRPMQIPPYFETEIKPFLNRKVEKEDFEMDSDEDE